MYLIDVPPPTISGQLHMGHVFSYCHMDFIARTRRFYDAAEWDEETGRHKPSKEDILLYPFCFDCNGLPTKKLANKEHIFDQSEIIKFAENKSEMYSDLFAKIGMGWSKHQYHTFQGKAITLSAISFDDLKSKGLAYKAVRDYYWCPITKESVSQSEIDENGCYERSGAKVELRTGEGWFINIMDHLPRLREAIDSIQWHPDHFRERLHRWLDDLKYDWSISRERKFGIHIPGEADDQVFDTWFTSSLSPQLAWMSHTGEPSLKCPIFDARFQAHDIIRTWAFFTIVKSIYHNNQIPWNRIIISGHALDRHGRKISKSAGNFVHPDTYIEKYGMAGVRYWAALNQVGTDTRCDEATMEKGKRLLNKIKNAYKFLRGNGKWGLEDWEPGCPGGQKEEYYWEAAKVFGRMQTYLEHDYNWPLALQYLTDFFWHTFCDKWIEECKKTPIYDTLYKVFDGMMDYFSIFLPNVRDELKEVDRLLK